MSTTLFSNMRNTFVNKDVIHSGVKVGRQKFAEYVRSQMRKGERDWSTYEVERRAQAKGHEISRTTVSNILNCKVKDVSEDKLNALAAAFEVPLAEVLAAYRGTADEDEKLIRNERLAALAADAEKLSPEDIPKFEALMDYVQTTVRQMIKEQGANALPRGKGKAAKSRVG
jgi:transcriptional regulator with XRE-family HTH domain